MQQSSILIGLLAAGLLLYLAANNRLLTYTNILWGTKPKDQSSGSGSQGSTTDYVELAAKAAEIAATA